ncbi:calcium/sodium antiporter [bacterium]|nr:calcium/sodium antiporter [bacterium]
MAFGTSAPELVVNLISSLKGNNALVFGNIVGSNIANILLVVGLGALIMPLTIKSQTLFKEIPLMVLGGLGLIILAFDKFFTNSPNIIDRSDGAILLLIFAIFVYYIIQSALSERGKVEKKFAKSIKEQNTLLSIVLIIVSAIGLFIGGKLVVDNAISLATILGVGEKLIGLTIVAIGTSLPELTTVIICTLKKNTDMAIGGIIGSNIFNTLFIFGLSSFITPVELNMPVRFDLSVMMIAFLLIFLFSLTKRRIEKWEGFVLFVIYLVYILMLILGVN